MLTIEDRIEAELVGFEGAMSVYADDFRGNGIRIRCDESFETGSVIKAFILGVLLQMHAQGELDAEERIAYEERHHVSGSGILKSCDPGSSFRIRDLENWMIAVSDNIATNMLLDFVGIERLNRGIREQGFTNTEILNRLDFTKWHTFGNTTPADYGSLLSDIARKSYIDADISGEMLDILLKQQHNPMLCGDIAPYLLNTYDQDENIIRVASKSGTMNQARNDGGIFLTPNGTFVIAIFTKDFPCIMEYDRHPCIVTGSRVASLIFNHYLSLRS